MAIEVWISSVCAAKGVFALREAVKSALPHPVRIVLSICTEADISEVEALLTSHTVIRRDKPLHQFEHIRALSRERVLYDEDFVIFLDDDDILFPNLLLRLQENTNTDGWVALQYIALHKETGLMIPGQESLRFEGIRDFLIRHSQDMPLETDFSGTGIRFKHLKRYLDETPVNPLIVSLEDTKLMNYIEHLPGRLFLTQPIAIHRLHPEPNLWLDNFLESVRLFHSSHLRV